MSTHPVALACIQQMRAELGLGETPPGSNRNHVVDEYNTTVDAIGPGPWCEMFQTVERNDGGARAITHQRAYTPWTVQDFIAGKLGSSWHWGTSGIQPGDRVYFDWNRPNRQWNSPWAVDHVGCVEALHTRGTFYTLEGNLGDRVQRVLRDAKYVVGYGRPDWDQLPRLGGGMSAPVSKPTPAPHPSTSKRHLVVDGKPGPNYVRRKQQWLGTTADGVVSGQSAWILEHNPGLRARGRDVWALGSRGSDMVRADQRRLAHKGLYRGAIDGLAGPKYWTALQTELHTSRDGVVSDPSDVIRADQRRLNREN